MEENIEQNINSGTTVTTKTSSYNSGRMDNVSKNYYWGLLGLAGVVVIMYAIGILIITKSIKKHAYTPPDTHGWKVDVDTVYLNKTAIADTMVMTVTYTKPKGK